LLSVVLFLCALLFYYLAVLRIDFYKTSFVDLGPYPDAVEYFAQANSLVNYGRPTLQIGYDQLPSRYPPGYPILMVPWLKLLPKGDAVLAPFRTNETIGLLLLLGCFAFYSRIGKPLSGGVATLLFSTQPAFVTYSRASMSDLSGAVALLLAVALTYLGFRRNRRGPIYGAAIVLGLSLCIKPQLVFFSPLLVAMALFPSPSRMKWLLHCLFVGLVFAFAASPYFILNTLQFGHPLKTGYDFWVPAFMAQAPFSIHNIPNHLGMIWSQLTLRWGEFGVSNLFGTGTYVVPVFVILAVVGLAFFSLSRFEISVLLAGVVFFVATACYIFVDGRFYLPLYFLLVPVAVLPVEWAMAEISKRKQVVLSLGVLVIFTFSCLGYPSQSGYKPVTGRFQAWDAIKSESELGKPRFYRAQKKFARAFYSRPGIVLSDIDPAYLNALLPRQFVAAPVNGTHSYCYSQLWHYGSAEAVRLVRMALSQKTPIYALLCEAQPAPAKISDLPAIKGYSWRQEQRIGLKTVVMVLAKNGSQTKESLETSNSNRARDVY
jgi:hypothetical protein